jgi:hypothetical protein
VPEVAFLAARAEVRDAINFSNMSIKMYYDQKHTAMFIKPREYTILRLYKGYSILSTKSKKLN